MRQHKETENMCRVSFASLIYYASGCEAERFEYHKAHTTPLIGGKQMSISVPNLITAV